MHAERCRHLKAQPAISATAQAQARVDAWPAPPFNNAVASRDRRMPAYAEPNAAALPAYRPHGSIARFAACPARQHPVAPLLEPAAGAVPEKAFHGEAMRAITQPAP